MIIVTIFLVGLGFLILGYIIDVIDMIWGLVEGIINFTIELIKLPFKLLGKIFK